MRISWLPILLFAAHTCPGNAGQPQSWNLVGHWKVDITFEDQSSRSLRFDAEDSGKGSLLLEGSRPGWDEAPEPSQAKWTADPEKHVTILGPVEFPIGNVGREPG